MKIVVTNVVKKEWEKAKWLKIKMYLNIDNILAEVQV